MSSYPLIKYVDSPAVAAVVRYDFNDQTPNLATAPVKKVTEFDPGVPTLEGDPDAVGQSWGFRSPSITHTIKGTKAQAMAALSAVSKEQLRRTNWLLFQPSASKQPVWFKTYRTGYQPITLDQVWVRTSGGGEVPLPDTWKITVPLVADAFTYGARVTMSTFQVIQSPADLAGPTRTAMRVVLPAIQGDAPTPLRVNVTPASASSGVYSSWLIGCICGSASMSDPVIDIGTGDTFTAGSGTGAGVSDTAYFNGSYRLVTISAGANLLQRLSGNLTVTPPVGRYKVLARVEADGASGASKSYTFAMGITLSGFAATYLPASVITVNPDAVATTYTYRGWVDLGDFNIPADSIASREATSPAPPTTPSAAAGFSLKIGTSDGSAGAVRIDAFKLIPVDGVMVDKANILKATFSRQWLQTGATGVFDGDTESYWGIVTAGGTLFQSIPVMKGGFPVADPGAAQNLLLLMVMNHGSLATGTVSTISAKDFQNAVDVSYMPRFLHVGDGT